MAQEWIDSRWKGAWSVERNAAISVDRRTFRFPSRGAFDLFLYFEVPLKKKKRTSKKYSRRIARGRGFPFRSACCCCCCCCCCCRVVVDDVDGSAISTSTAASVCCQENRSSGEEFRRSRPSAMRTADAAAGQTAISIAEPVTNKINPPTSSVERPVQKNSVKTQSTLES